MTRPLGIVDHCDVRLPEGMGRALDRMASEQRCTRSELIRRIICDAIDYEPVERHTEPQEPPEPSFKAARAEPVDEAETILDLFQRGWTATQIAAMKRIRYRRVMEIIGKQVDKVTREFAGMEDGGP